MSTRVWSSWNSTCSGEDGPRLWKAVRHFLIKLDTHLSCNPTIPLFLIYSRKMKTRPQKDVYKIVQSSFIRQSTKLETTQMFINRRGFFKVSYIIQWRTTQQQKERTLIQATWWMNLKNTVKQKKPDAIEYLINVWFPLYGISRAGRTHLWWWKLEHWAPVGTDWKGSRESFWDDGDVLCFGWWDGHVGVYIDQNSSDCTPWCTEICASCCMSMVV